MAKYSLSPFTKSKLEIELTTEANWSDNSLYLGFTLTGKGLNQIEFGDYHPEHRRLLNLWEKTCFEFFIKNEKGHYLEFNFSPNFAWNIFTFTKIRGPLTELETKSTPVLDILNSSSKFFLVAKIDKEDLKNFTEKEYPLNQLSFSFNAVIKLKSGETEYWAIKHSDQRPNFHQFESFIGKF